MRVATFLAGTFIALGMAAVVTPVSAAPLAPLAVDSQTLIQNVADWDGGDRRDRGDRGDRWDRGDRGDRWGRGDGWRHHRFNRCHSWRRECADRWGWGGPRFRRCLWRHGC